MKFKKIQKAITFFFKTQRKWQGNKVIVNCMIVNAHGCCKKILLKELKEYQVIVGKL